MSLVRSQLLYCLPAWRPHFIKDIICLEILQRSTKFILNDYTSNYQNRLFSLQLLPLMMQLEINDIIYFIKSLKEPTHPFNIMNFVQFYSSGTRSSTYLKLKQPFYKKNCVRHFYFNRLPRLWNSLPPIDLDQPITSIKSTIYNHFWSHFLSHFNPDISCTYHYLCPCAKCASLPLSCSF